MHRISKYQQELEYNRYVVIPDIVSTKGANEALGALITSEPTGSVDVNAKADPDTLTLGGVTKYTYFDHADLLGVVHQASGWYDALISTVSFITGRRVVESPYYDSKIMALIYDSDGGQQEWHLDTQPLTVLLYLTTNPNSGATRCRIKGKDVDIFPQQASLLLMYGREVLHQALPVTEGVKVVVPMNMYLENDLWRPKGLLAPDYWEARGTNE